jgi:hypothetical protein
MADMPRALRYWHLRRELDLKPAEVDAMDWQVIQDLRTINHLYREIEPAQ